MRVKLKKNFGGFTWYNSFVSILNARAHYGRFGMIEWNILYFIKNKFSLIIITITRNDNNNAKNKFT